MTSPKRQHFLPEFYLKGFCDNGRLWVYYRDKKEFRRKRPKQTAISHHIYTLTESDGEKNTEIEQLFACVESETAPVIEKLDRGYRLNIDELASLCIFAGSLYIRTPLLKSKINRYIEDGAERIYEQMFPDGEPTDEVRERYGAETGKQLMTMRDGYEIRANKNYSLMMRTKLWRDLYNELWTLDWSLCSTPEGSSFITCDNPFTFAAPPEMEGKPVGILTEGTLKIIPLSGRSCLVMGDRGGRVCYNRVSRSHANWLNIHVAANSQRLVIARDRKHLEKLVKLAGID